MLRGTSNGYILPFLFVSCSARVKIVLSRCILIFFGIFIYLPYRHILVFGKCRITVSVSAYPYPVSVQRRLQGQTRNQEASETLLNHGADHD
jgi:hypothetical protein